MADFSQLTAIIHENFAKLTSQQEEIGRLRLELINAKFDVESTRARSRSPRRLEIIASNTPDRAAEALGLVAANTVIRTTVEADMRAEIVTLKAEVQRLQLREYAFESEIEDLIKGDGRIADVFHANWVGEREESSEDEEDGERDISAETQEERCRLNQEFQGTTVRQFLADVVKRLDDLSLHARGLTSSYMRRPR
jgi:hypothetical protein